MRVARKHVVNAIPLPNISHLLTYASRIQT